MIEQFIAFLAGLGLGPTGAFIALAAIVTIVLTALLVAVVNLVVNFADEQSAQSAQRPRAWPAVRVPPAAVGPTTRLRCCDAPDLPDGAQYCINCGRRVW